MKTVIIMASNVKEAKEIALKEHGKDAKYVKPYRYVSKGNNFYEFEVKSTGTLYYSIRVVRATSEAEAIEKVQNSDFETSDPLCDDVLTINDLGNKLAKREE